MAEMMKRFCDKHTCSNFLIDDVVHVRIKGTYAGLFNNGKSHHYHYIGNSGMKACLNSGIRWELEIGCALRIYSVDIERSASSCFACGIAFSKN